MNCTLSIFGATRRINSELSPWTRELILRVSSPSFKEPVKVLKKKLSLLTTNILVTSLPAQPTLELD